jgi:hypothetical protein
MFSQHGCWLFLRKNGTADGQPNNWKVYRYDAAANTLELRASASVLPTALGENSRGAGTVLPDGRIFKNDNAGNLWSYNNSLVQAGHGKICNTSTETLVGHTLPSPTNGWLLAVVQHKTSLEWEIRAATDTRVVTLVGPTPARISNLHWNPELEGFVLRWNEGITLKRSSFDVLQEIG